MEIVHFQCARPVDNAWVCDIIDVRSGAEKPANSFFLFLLISESKGVY